MKKYLLSVFAGFFLLTPVQVKAKLSPTVSALIGAGIGSGITYALTQTNISELIKQNELLVLNALRLAGAYAGYKIGSKVGSRMYSSFYPPISLFDFDPERRKKYHTIVTKVSIGGLFLGALAGDFLFKKILKNKLAEVIPLLKV